jgi:hypothetical protein
MSPLNSKDLIELVRERINDQGIFQWSDTQILKIADKHLQVLWERLQDAGQSWDAGQLEITQADLTADGRNRANFVLPEYVGQIKYLESAVSSETRAVEVIPMEFYNRQSARSASGGFLGWIRIGSGRLGGKVELNGAYQSIGVFTLHFARRWTPLHQGTAAAGSTTTMQFASSPTGEIVKRDDLYIGMEFEITNDLPSGVQDQLAVITAYDASTGANGEVTFDTLGVAPTTPQGRVHRLLDRTHRSRVLRAARQPRVSRCFPDVARPSSLAVYGLPVEAG